MSTTKNWGMIILSISMLTLLACGTSNRPDASTKYIETMRLVIETTAVSEANQSALSAMTSTSSSTPVATGTFTPVPSNTSVPSKTFTPTLTKTVPRIIFNTGAPPGTGSSETTSTSQPTSDPDNGNSPAATNTKSPVPTNTDVPAPTENNPAAPTDSNPVAPSRTSTSTATSTSTSTATQTEIPPTATENVPSTDPNVIVWKATHENGDISEWQQHGDFIRQGMSAWYSMITPFSHTGNYSVSLTIDTEGQSSSGSFAAYLFFWDQLPGDGYYYSAWYYIPSGTQPQHWWNVWQWKSTYNGSTDYSVPVYALDISERWDGQLILSMLYRPDSEREKIEYEQNTRTVPTDQWFHIEGYYERAVDNSGKVIIWQDGVEIFNFSNVQTTMEDNTVYWSVNNYTDEIIPSLVSIYIDDAAITTERIGPNFILP